MEKLGASVSNLFWGGSESGGAEGINKASRTSHLSHVTDVDKGKSVQIFVPGSESRFDPTDLDELLDPKREVDETELSEESDGEGGEERPTSLPRTPEPVVYDKYAWTHPSHHTVTVLGLFMQLVSLNLILISEFVCDWYYDDDVELTINKYGNQVICGQLTYGDIKNPETQCPGGAFYYNGQHPFRCVYAENVKEGSDFLGFNMSVQFFIQMCVWLGIGFSAIALLLHWLVFWPLLIQKDKVYHAILRSLVSIDSWGVVVKMLAGWEVVYFGPKYTETAYLKICDRDLQYNYNFLGFIFFSSIAELVAVMTFLLALDKGNGEETHLERLAKEHAAKDTLRKEIREVRRESNRRRSTYTKENIEHLKKISSKALQNKSSEGGEAANNAENQEGMSGEEGEGGSRSQFTVITTVTNMKVHKEHRDSLTGGIPHVVVNSPEPTKK